MARNREIGNAINIDMICDEEDPGGSDDDTGPRIAVKKDHRAGYEDIGAKDKSRKGGSHEGNSAMLIAAEMPSARARMVPADWARARRKRLRRSGTSANTKIWMIR